MSSGHLNRLAFSRPFTGSGRRLGRVWRQRGQVSGIFTVTSYDVTTNYDLRVEFTTRSYWNVGALSFPRFLGGARPREHQVRILLEKCCQNLCSKFQIIGSKAILLLETDLHRTGWGARSPVPRVSGKVRQSLKAREDPAT